jgi:glycosyltransferase involved in cell wall biosynthesis
MYYMSNPDQILVIVPVYNEGAEMLRTITQLIDAGYKVIVVDDGSATPIKESIAHLPVTILRHRVNLGQGAALQTAFAFAKKLHPFVVITFDADGQHDANDIPAMIAPIREQRADIVLGSRFLPESGNGMSSSKKWLLQVARFINFLLSGTLLSDAHNGFRAMNRLALEKIELTENRMAHASEILFETRKHKLRFCEVPVNIRYTDYSKQKGQSAPDSIKVLFDLVLHKLFK